MAAAVELVPPLAIATIPVNVPAAAGTVISALPSNATPLMFFEAANLVAVPALPVTLQNIG